MFALFESLMILLPVVLFACVAGGLSPRIVGLLCGAALAPGALSGFFFLLSGITSVRANLRGLLLVAAWPWIHALLVVTVLGLRARIGFVVGLSVLLLGADSFWRGLSIATLSLPIVTLVARFALGVPLKLIGDVARYLGSPDYVNRIQSQLGVELDRIVATKPTSLVLLTHSLGTVIATEWLSNNAERLRQLERVTLITMGSPLKRFFCRLFPGFFPSPEEIFRDLRSRVPRFCWVNIYRPGDPVGTSLALPRDAACAEVSTRQHRWMFAFIGAHNGYWSDTRVATALATSLRKMTPYTPNCEASPRATWASRSRISVGPFAKNISRLMAFASVVVLVASVCVTSWRTATTIDRLQDLESKRIEDEFEKNSVTGFLYCTFTKEEWVPRSLAPDKVDCTLFYTHDEVEVAHSINPAPSLILPALGAYDRLLSDYKTNWCGHDCRRAFVDYLEKLNPPRTDVLDAQYTYGFNPMLVELQFREGNLVTS